MLNEKKVYAVIPVRGASVGIPRKNLYRLGKDTLLERTIKQGKACSYIDHVIVSTDDPEMHEIARRYGVQSPALRPAHLATSLASTLDVLVHVIHESKIRDAYVLLLQTTCPLRTLDDLSRLFTTFEQNRNRAEAVVSLALQDAHPAKAQKIEDGYVVSYLGGESMVPRQSLPVAYRPNGAFYLTHCDVLMEQHTFFPKRTLPVLMPEERSINLDTPFDLECLEALLSKGVVKLEEYA